ncbi:MAG: murein biosynthesis integral membrane protein MurJ [Thiohalobacteraceae bacterium]
MRRGIIRDTAVVSAMTLLSRILGFARDLILARVFGAGGDMDAFFVAFKIPNFLRRLFAEGAFSLAFVPVIGEYRARRDHADVRELTRRVAGTLAGILLLVSVVGILASPLVVSLFAPGFLDEPEKFDLTAQMLRVTFSYIFFISLVALASGIFNTYERFALPAFAPVLLNLVMIAAAWWAAPHFEVPVMALAWAVAIGGVAQLLIMFPTLRRLNLLTWPRWGWRHEGVQRILKLMGPAILGSSVAQINLLLDTIIASFLVTGSVSWLYYSDRMVEFPLGVFGIALSTVILPSLSRTHANADPGRFQDILDRGLRWVVLLSIPAALGLFLLSGPIMIALFQYDQFGVNDARMAALSLMALAVGLPAFILIKVLAPAFYARQDTRTPVRIAIIAMIANMGLNLAFVLPMLYFDIPGPHAGLALATASSAWLNAWLLYRALRAAEVYAPRAGWRPVLLRVSVASILMAALLWFGVNDAATWVESGSAERLTRLALSIGIAAVVYLGTLQLLGQNLHALWQRPDRAPPEQ